MSFSAETYSDILTRMAETSYKLIGDKPRFSRNKTIISYTWRPQSSKDIIHNSYHSSLYMKTSAHQEIQRKQFLNERTDDIMELVKTLKKDMPALDFDDLDLSIIIRCPTLEKKPRIILEIMQARLSSSEIQIPTIIAKLKTLSERLSPAQKPAQRQFLINDNLIPAHDPYDAVRLYSALHAPKIFEAEAHHYCQVSEVLNPDPLFNALFYEPEPAAA